MHQSTRPAIGDIVATAVPLRYGINGHLSTIQPTTLGHVTRHLEPDIVEVDFGQEGTRPVHVAVLDLVEFPDGIDLGYLGDTTLEFALRACEAYVAQRERADLLAAAIAQRPLLVSPSRPETRNGHHHGSRS